MHIILAKKIKEERVKLSLTQQQIADKIGIKRSKWASYEENRARPKVDELLQIAKFFSITIENLLTGEPMTREEAQGIQMQHTDVDVFLSFWAIINEVYPDVPFLNNTSRYFMHPIGKKMLESINKKYKIIRGPDIATQERPEETLTIVGVEPQNSCRPYVSLVRHNAYAKNSIGDHLVIIRKDRDDHANVEGFLEEFKREIKWKSILELPVWVTHCLMMNKDKTIKLQRAFIASLKKNVLLEKKVEELQKRLNACEAQQKQSSTTSTPSKSVINTR